MVTQQVFQTSSNNRIGIVTANHTGYVEATLSCLEAGDVVVPLRSPEDDHRIQAAGVNKILVPESGSAWMTPKFRAPISDRTALIAFTSGTEGNPKGVILTHRNLANVILRLNTLMKVDDSIREYIGVPVYHSFGLGRCRAVAAAGGSFFIPGNGFNPSEIGVMLRNGEINALSAVPSLWRVLLANKDVIGQYGKKMRWIEIGSQYMSRQEKEELKALFPEARIVQHYGLTEASRTTLLQIHQEEGEALESVGQALAGVSVTLTETGRIAISGDHVADSYLIDGQQQSLRDGNGWFLTNDLGRLEKGYLYYQGRADDIINCGGIKVQPETLETKIYASLGYSNNLAICRKSDPLRGEGFLVAITRESEIDRQKVREAVLHATQELGVNAANAITLVDVDSLPRTASGKVQRKKLSEWYAQQASIQDQPQENTPTDLSPVQTIFCRVLNLRSINPQDTFISLGGDSLSYVQLSMALERHLGNLPQDWEQLPVSQLEKPTLQGQRFTRIETNILLRAFAICGVVINHAELLPVLGGGSMLLLLIAGLNFARFQGTALIQGRFSKPVVSLLRNLILPYLAIAFAFQVYKREIDLSVLLLVSNFVSPYVTSIFPVWFIDVLVQSIIIFALLFNVRAVRNLAEHSPWRLGLILLSISVAANILMPFFWDTNYLFNRLPHMLMWLFTLGWCVHYARSKVQKLMTTLVILVLFAIMSSHGVSPEDLWIWGGALLILWMPYLSIPQQIKLPVQTIGASAYYIYLTHMIFVHIVKNGLKIPDPLLNTVVALVGGVLVWSGVQALQGLRAKRRSQGQRMSANTL